MSFPLPLAERLLVEPSEPGSPPVPGSDHAGGRNDCEDDGVSPAPLLLLLLRYGFLRLTESERRHGTPPVQLRYYTNPKFSQIEPNPTLGDDAGPHP